MASLTEEEHGTLQPEVELVLQRYKKPEDYFVGCKSEHQNYYSMSDLTLGDLPKDIRVQEILRILKLNWDLVVRVALKGEEADVEDNTGSGSVCYFSDTHNLFHCMHGDVDTCQLCHIPNCPFSEKLGKEHYMVTNFGVQNLTAKQLEKAHLAFRVSTNKHVVATCSQAARTVVELFYDTEDKDGTVYAQGVCLCGEWEEQDKVHIVCVTELHPRVFKLLTTMRHEMRAAFAAVPELQKTNLIEKYVIVVAHPHGLHKVVSIGTKIKSMKKTSKSGRRYTETLYSAETCRGCSGAAVIGPGWEDGGPAYRVHCGVFDQSGYKVSKSFWVVGGKLDNSDNFEAPESRWKVFRFGFQLVEYMKNSYTSMRENRRKCCKERYHKALPSSV